MDDEWHLIIDLISIFLTSEIGHIFMFIGHLGFTPEVSASIFWPF